MTKKRSKCLFVLFAILLVICLIACFVNFTYPFSIGGKYYNYSNFVSNVRLGEDVGNSLRIVYRAELPENEIATNFDNLKTNTMNSLKDIVQGEGFKDVTVAEYGQDCILLQIGNILTEEDENSLVALVGNPATISFSTNSDGTSAFAGSKHIKSVSTTQYQPQGTADISYIVIIEFKDEFKSMVSTQSAGKTVYIHLGENQFAELNYSTSEITDGIIYLQSDTIKSMVDANTLANRIKTGMLSLELTQIQCETVTPSYGVGAGLWLAIALTILFLASFIFLIVKYKHMGWLASFAMLFFVTIGLFLIQSIPLAHANLSGLIAMGICYLIALDTLIAILETAKKHYQADTKLYIAFKMSMKENMAKTFIFNALFMIAGLLCLFMPAMSLQSFGWIAFILPIVSVFISQALMRLFIKMYLALNNENGKKCNFHKGGKNA